MTIRPMANRTASIRSVRDLAFACLVSTSIVGCSSTDSATRDDPSTPATDAPAEESPAAADSAAPAPAASAEATPEKASPPADAQPAGGTAPTNAPAAAETFQRSKDGIDDDNPLPRDKASEAAIAFQQASETARSNPAAAVARFVDAAGKTTYFYAAYFNAATASEAAGDLAGAERYYREALKIRPDYGPALANLYLLYRAQNKVADANRVVDDALRTHAESAGPHLAAATRAQAARDVSLTESEALQALKLDERSVPAMRLMAWVFFEQRRFESAAFALENALKLEPGNGLLHLELGHVQLKLKEERKALEAFGRAAKLRPELADAQENYGVLMLQYGETDEAVVAFQKVVTLRPKSASAQLHLGNGLRAQKKYVEAEAAYKKALELDPKMASVHFNLGLLYIDNELPGVDYLERLKRAEGAMTAYAAAGEMPKEVATRVDDYQGTLTKLITREEKKRQRDAERKAIEDDKKAKAGAKPAEAPTDEAAPSDAPPSENKEPEGASPDASPDAVPTTEAEPAAAGGENAK